MKSNYESKIVAMMQGFKSEIERLKEERDKKIMELYSKIEEIAKNSVEIQRGVDDLTSILNKPGVKANVRS